jgi:nucleoside 2-deoxyribosyltransferase
MKLFVASSYLNKANARAAMRKLRKAGHEITFDWTQPEQMKTDADWRRKASEDFRGVVNAEVLIVIWPGRMGTSTEVGIALGRGIPVFIVGDPGRTSVYWYHPLVAVVPDLDTALLELGE